MYFVYCKLAVLIIYGDIDILHCSSKWSATPTKFVILILIPYCILFYVTFDIFQYIFNKFLKYSSSDQ